MFKQTVFNSLFVSVLSFSSVLQAKSEDGYTCEDYDTKEAQAAFSMERIAPTIEKIFSAFTDEGKDPEYLAIFENSPVSQGDFFEYVVYYACINKVLHDVTACSLEIIGLESLLCFVKYYPEQILDEAFLKHVQSIPETNSYREAVLDFLSFFKTNQNLLNISELIQY